MANCLVTSLFIKAAINKQFELVMFSCCTETIQRSFVASNTLVGCSLTFIYCISVTDDVEINEQIKSIATGLLYVQPEFDTFSTLELTWRNEEL